MWIMTRDQDQDQEPKTKDVSYCIESVCKDDVHGVPAFNECPEDFLMHDDCKQA